MGKVEVEGERTRHGSAACTSVADRPTEPFRARSGSGKVMNKGPLLL